MWSGSRTRMNSSSVSSSARLILPAFAPGTPTISRCTAPISREMGAVHLEIVGVPGAKAGKINRALELTDEEFILVLDPDHIPLPQFLDRVLGYFADEKVG